MYQTGYLINPFYNLILQIKRIKFSRWAIDPINLLRVQHLPTSYRTYWHLQWDPIILPKLLNINDSNSTWIHRIYSTTRVYVNCADEFHTLLRRVVRRAYTIFLRVRSKKMRESCAFVIQRYKFPLYFSAVWNIGLLGLKKRWVDNGKFT